MSCSGYYDYDEGYTPDFAGTDKFQGPIVHAQHWPDNLDYRDKRVVVIGSGATAITLVPTMARETQSLVMLQRSPTYIADIPLEEPAAMRAAESGCPWPGLHGSPAGKKCCIRFMSIVYLANAPKYCATSCSARCASSWVRITT